MKIGLFGGSFDPPTIAHVNIARSILEQNVVDKIWVLPCKVHAYDKSLSDFYNRWFMCIKAFSDLLNVTVLPFDKTGKAYDVVKWLTTNFSNNKFYYIVGMDCANDVKNWYRFEDLKRLVKFIKVERPGYTSDSDFIDTIVHIEPIDVSSTMIRNLVKEKKDIRGLVPSEVYDFIKENKLYECT
jgi:nicotinate-nucleotide adenylyltransferase